MSTIFVSHSGSVALPHVNLKAWDINVSEAVATQDHNALDSRFTRSYQGTASYTGSCSCALNPGGKLDMGPWNNLVTLSPASDDPQSAAPNIFAHSIELTIEQALRNYVIPPTSTGPAVNAAIGTKITSTFRVIGFGINEGKPFDETNWRSQRFNAKFFLTDAHYVQFDATIQSYQVNLQDGVVDLTIEGRNSTDIVTDSTDLFNLTNMGGDATFAFITGKTLSGPIAYSRIGFVRDAGKCGVNIDWHSTGEMKWAWA